MKVWSQAMRMHRARLDMHREDADDVAAGAGRCTELGSICIGTYLRSTYTLENAPHASTRSSGEEAHYINSRKLVGETSCVEDQYVNIARSVAQDGATCGAG